MPRACPWVSTNNSIRLNGEKKFKSEFKKFIHDKVSEKIDGFNMREIVDVDDKDNAHLLYGKIFDENKWPPEEKNRIYKVSPEGDLLARFDFRGKINRQNQDVYGFEIDNNLIRVTKWGKVSH